MVQNLFGIKPTYKKTIYKECEFLSDADVGIDTFRNVFHMPVHIRKFMCVQVKNKIEKRNEQMENRDQLSDQDIKDLKQISPSQIQNKSKGPSQMSPSSQMPKSANVDISKLRNKFS